jgi:hypothetical protein
VGRRIAAFLKHFGNPPLYNPAFGTNHTLPAPIKAFPRFQTIFLNTC